MEGRKALDLFLLIHNLSLFKSFYYVFSILCTEPGCKTLSNTHFMSAKLLLPTYYIDEIGLACVDSISMLSKHLSGASYI